MGVRADRTVAESFRVMRQQPPFEPFEHDADLGLRVRGRSFEELCANAARGMVQLMVDPAAVRPVQDVRLQAEGDDAEMLLVDWLNQILFAFEVDRFVPAQVEVTAAGAGRLQGLLRGETLDESRHETRHAIKAVTYHRLSVRKTGEGYEVSIVFDV